MSESKALASAPSQVESALQAHTTAVGDFLREMYATLVDPVDAPASMSVAEMCAVLLDAARKGRQDASDLQALREREIERKAAVEAWFERHTNIANEAADAGNPFADVRAFVIRDTLADFPHIKAARDGA